MPRLTKTYPTSVTLNLFQGPCFVVTSQTQSARCKIAPTKQQPIRTQPVGAALCRALFYYFSAKFTSVSPLMR
jgi:hypothetical protein